MSIRKDIFRIHVQPHMYFLVFHKDLKIGFGPALCLYIHGIEFLKFDCFGYEKGHYHIFNGITNKGRIYFEEETVEEQIQKTYSELCNLEKYLEESTLQRIRNYKIEIEFYMPSLEKAIEKLLEYEKLYSELRVLTD